MPFHCPLLVLNGDLDAALARWLHEVRGGQRAEEALAPFSARGELLAVDGGADRLMEHGLAAELVVGDLDSASDTALAWHRRHGAEILPLPDQERNDLEKALDLAQERGARQACIAAFEGTRLDMLFGLVTLLNRPAAPTLLLLGTDQLLRALPAGEHRLPLPAGEPFSLVSPVAPVRVALGGARWPLTPDRPLAPGCRGVSNLSLGSGLKLSSDGPLLLFTRAPWSGGSP
jgi:thiamine pyrophosphokinase